MSLASCADQPLVDFAAALAVGFDPRDWFGLLADFAADTNAYPAVAGSADSQAGGKPGLNAQSVAEKTSIGVESLSDGSAEVRENSLFGLDVDSNMQAKVRRQRLDCLPVWVAAAGAVFEVAVLVQGNPGDIRVDSLSRTLEEAL
jgi:hypothetical protein